MAEHRVPVPGGELYARADGSGPAVVLIHAGIAHSDMWQPQVDWLAGRHTVIRYDTRGFGRSQSEKTTYSNRADLLAVLDYFAVSRAVITGCSRGGNIAVDFTLEFPERVAGLVTVCGGLGGFELPEALHDPALNELFEKMDGLYEAGQFEELNEYEMQVFVDGPGQPVDRVDADLRAWVKEMNRLNFAQTEVNEGSTPIPLEPPAAGRLDEIQVPTLVMIGDLDTPGTRAAADALAAGIPRARQVVIPGTAHLPKLEQPARFATELGDFLHRVGW